MENFDLPKYEDSGIHHDFCRLLAAIVAFTDTKFSHEEQLDFRKQYFSRLRFFLNLPEDPMGEEPPFDPVWN